MDEGLYGTSPHHRSHHPPAPLENQDVVDQETQESVVSPSWTGGFYCGRHLDRLRRLATIGPDRLLPQRQGSSLTPMSNQSLVLLIVGVAALVAIGILTG
jgi:hypothetical protein